ncbi:hypothetical protein BGZ70_007733 [Mortierella alpina]|uniref:Triacylglycerol lipase n=1 Tax=Mortierella alpina TaxID=64518 RepID=A0A9P6J7D1_MORAP|nr:hypothetical protein BGZ70_007733 [Mortierella alpina]
MLVKSVLSIVGMVAATMATTASAAAPKYGGYNDFSCKLSPAHPYPLILLHGLGGNSLSFAYLASRFALKGYCIFALDYGHVEGIPILGGIADMMVSGQEVANFVDRVLNATRATKVDFLGHSEGSNLMRVYVKYFNGVSKTGALTAIGSNQYGTEFAHIVTFLRTQNLWNGVEATLQNICKPCVQLVTNSTFLAKLNEGGDTYPEIKYLMLASKYDELITPYTQGFLRTLGPNVHNVVLQDLCKMDYSMHITQAYDPIVFHAVDKFLSGGNYRDVDCSYMLKK